MKQHSFYEPTFKFSTALRSQRPYLRTIRDGESRMATSTFAQLQRRTYIRHPLCFCRPPQQGSHSVHAGDIVIVFTPMACMSLAFSTSVKCEWVHRLSSLRYVVYFVMFHVHGALSLIRVSCRDTGPQKSMYYCCFYYSLPFMSVCPYVPHAQLGLFQPSQGAVYVHP